MPGGARLRLKEGTVLRILETSPRTQRCTVRVEGEEAEALCYPELTGPLARGDRVWLNTAALELGLGSGGYHLVAAVPGRLPPGAPLPGRIMKLRYTPWQLAVEAVEEAAPDRLREGDLEGMPVVVGSLHSQLLPVALGFQAASGGLPLAYVMTDGGALPAALSRSAAALRARGLLAGTVTCGHAFGGDLEAVHPASGLLAARTVLGAAGAAVIMGPGITGTGSAWGHTALEQGSLLDLASALGGDPVAVVRISQRDARVRHQGVSHHTLTALGRVAARPATVVLPLLHDRGRLRGLQRQLWEAGVLRRHRLVHVPVSRDLVRALAAEPEARTMGRDVEEEQAFFEAALAAGWEAGRRARRRQGGVDG
ncbi:DUF3866 family protein [Limnochorda pilosa]|uniref:DUF3866 domain-containing protein n=1 Tax=Limnochorda pilosa TaxID=1555112 RepID=A0A0K2SKA4_LIMPI|nr:DUF3866 family protein [Limnochorda pilosa]BAS27546.1 hypothetical protein LIP_1700 [Limnochorda pilosa]